MSRWIDLPDRVAAIQADVVDVAGADWPAVATAAQEHPQILRIAGVGAEETLVALPLRAFEQLLDFVHFPDGDMPDDVD